MFMTEISIIVAVGKNNVIGSDGKLPWHMPADLKRFKELTTGKPVIMGRKTYESIGKPLPNRTNIILTRSADYEAGGCIVVNSLDEALEATEGEKEAMIIGGASIYAQFLPKARRIYMTQIDALIEGDVYFPAVSGWREVNIEHHKKDDKNPHDYTFVIFERS